MIDILLSTFNGEKYLFTLLNSLSNQTYKNIRLIIRDDGSSDGTIDVIHKYKQKAILNIVFYEDFEGNIGSTASFQRLIEYSDAEYFMLCDQDDEWLKNKVELSYNGILVLEKKYPNIPLMIFTDLVVCNESMNVISESFFRFQNLNPKVCYNTWKSLSMSVAAGCTMILNNISKEYILPIPSFQFHDYWIMGCIAHRGKCDYIDIPTIKYRQHEHNLVGAKKVKYSYFNKKLMALPRTYLDYKRQYKSFPFTVNLYRVAYYKFLYNMIRLSGIKFNSLK